MSSTSQTIKTDEKVQKPNDVDILKDINAHKQKSKYLSSIITYGIVRDKHGRLSELE